MQSKNRNLSHQEVIAYTISISIFYSFDTFPCMNPRLHI